MFATKTTKLWMIAGAVVAAVVLTGAALQDAPDLNLVKPKPDKLCPITFHLDPVTTLQARFARDIEHTNADFAVLLAMLRTAIENKTLNIESMASQCQAKYAKTYLEQPVLWEGGKIRSKGWLEIVQYLGTSVIPHTTYIHPQTVNVYLEYLPLSERVERYIVGKRSVNLHGFKPEEIDFLAMIRTVIAYAPYDDPMEIGNEGPIPHRTVCDPIY